MEHAQKPSAEQAEQNTSDNQTNTAIEEKPADQDEPSAIVETKAPTLSVNSDYTDSSDKDRNDWERLSMLGEGGLTYYLYQHPNGKWVDEARVRIERLRKEVAVWEAKRPLNMVELYSPDIMFTFLSTGKTYHYGDAFPPPKTIDCSRLRLTPDAFKDAIKAGALIVRIKAPPEAKLIKSIDKKGKKGLKL